MMNRLFVLASLGALLAAPAFAQGQQQQAPPTTAAFLRNLYNGNKNNIIRSAEKVSEDLYGLRPAPRARRQVQLPLVLAGEGREESEHRSGSGEVAEDEGGIPEGARRFVRLLRSRLSVARRPEWRAGRRDSAGERPRDPQHTHGAADAQRRAQQRALWQPRDDHAHEEHRAALVRAASRAGATALGKERNEARLICTIFLCAPPRAGLLPPR